MSLRVKLIENFFLRMATQKNIQQLSQSYQHMLISNSYLKEIPYFLFVEWADMSHKHMARLGTKHSNIGENLFTAIILFFLFKSPEHINAIYQHRGQRFKFFNPKILKILPSESFVRLRKDFCINFAYPSSLFCIFYYFRDILGGKIPKQIPD